MEDLGLGCVMLLVVLFFIGLLTLPFVKWQMSEELVSGIVYNNTNDRFISGNTKFYVRAGVDTYVNENNKSSYCLPPNSPYISLVKEAASNKDIKVTVLAKKSFQLMMPWQCMANVTVEKSK